MEKKNQEESHGTPSTPSPEIQSPFEELEVVQNNQDLPNTDIKKGDFGTIIYIDMIDGVLNPGFDPEKKEYLSLNETRCLVEFRIKPKNPNIDTDDYADYIQEFIPFGWLEKIERSDLDPP